MKNIFFIFTGMIFSACASTTFVKTGSYERKPRAPGCDFKVYTTPPSHFNEVGLIKFYTGTGNNVYTIEGVKTTAQEYVCKAGGNGIILPEPKDLIYPQATVIITE